MSRAPATPAAGPVRTYAEMLAAHEARRRTADDLQLRKMINVRVPQQPS